ncbi:dTDP-4-dehydrorhamnose 3,5-epimerase [Allopusillimonas ginsengisoli]|uniref:dTDP-4-dehydrorhamnose 3,5-epimerase n=1 Tax=Allopusillimonas ginsengisoli TaxID=453575 RepID=UPI0039C0399A
MKLTQTCIPDVVVIEPAVFEDDRGWFIESFNERQLHNEMKALGLSAPPAFVQDNHSRSRQGTLRGLHYQMTPYAQGKLVRVVQGSVFDVAVDLRRESDTFGQWVGIALSGENKKMVWIPEGFAHGFLSLEDDTHLLYKTTNYYSKDSERSIVWNDPDLAISWPPVQSKALAISNKDQEAMRMKDVVRLGWLF